MAEGKSFANNTLYRGLNQPLLFYFDLCVQMCESLGGFHRGYIETENILAQ